MEAECYLEALGKSYLNSAVTVGTHLDKIDEDEKEAAMNNVKEKIKDTFKEVDIPFCPFSSKLPSKEQMIDDILEVVANLKPYSNAEIERIQKLVAEEVTR